MLNEYILKKEITDLRTVLFQTMLVGDFVYKLNDLLGNIPFWINEIEEGLGKSTIDVDDVKCCFGHIESAIHSTQRYVQTLKNTPEIKSIPLNELLSNVVKHYSRVYNDKLMNSNIKLEFEDSISEWDVTFNINLLKFCVCNLVMNAIDFASNDSIVQIKLYNTTERYTIAVFNNALQDITPIADKIFTPYFSTKDNGTGLSLWKTKQIAEEYKGEIHFTYSDTSVAFYISLPKNNN